MAIIDINLLHVSHIKNNCHVQLVVGNASTIHKSEGDRLSDWEKCLSSKVIEKEDDANTSINCKECIIDSSCSRHLIGNDCVLGVP